jgi:hypothetical protein
MEKREMYPSTARRRTLWRGVIIAACLVAIGVLAGCGGGAGAATTSSNSKADAREAVLKFTQCMRDHGINLPDPQISSDGKGGTIKIQGGGPGGVNIDDAKFQAAQKACGKYLPNGGELSPSQQAQAQQKGLEFARCMRAHGVDIPDPQVGSNGVRIGGNGVKINPDDPHFQAAQKACGSIFGAAGPGFSTGGGGDSSGGQGLSGGPNG